MKMMTLKMMMRMNKTRKKRMMKSKEEKMQAIAYNISKLLYIQGWTQLKLAKALGVSHTTIQNYVNQKKLASDSSIKKLAEIAGVTEEEFLIEGSF